MTPSSFTAKGKIFTWSVLIYPLISSFSTFPLVCCIPATLEQNRISVTHQAHTPTSASLYLLFLLPWMLFSPDMLLGHFLTSFSPLFKYCYWRDHFWSSYVKQHPNPYYALATLLWFSFLHSTWPTEYLLISDCLSYFSKMASLIGRVLGQVCSLLHHQCLDYFDSSVNICWMNVSMVFWK